MKNAQVYRTDYMDRIVVTKNMKKPTLFCFACWGYFKVFFFSFFLAPGNQAGKQQQPQQHYPIGGVCDVPLLAYRILISDF